MNCNWGMFLRYASKNGNLDIIKFLIEHGANIEIGTPLAIAVENNHIDVARFFIENDAIYTYKLLETAVQTNNIDMCRLILEFFSKVKPIDDNDELLLSYEISSAKARAEEQGYIDIVTLLKYF